LYDIHVVAVVVNEVKTECVYMTGGAHTSTWRPFVTGSVFAHA